MTRRRGFWPLVWVSLGVLAIPTASWFIATQAQPFLDAHRGLCLVVFVAGVVFFVFGEPILAWFMRRREVSRALDLPRSRGSLSSSGGPSHTTHLTRSRRPRSSAGGIARSGRPYRKDYWL